MFGARESLLQPANVEIGGDHVARLTDACRQPARHGTTTGSDLQAAPPFGHTDIFQMAERDRIEERGERPEPVPGLERFVVEEILGIGHESRNLVRSGAQAERLATGRHLMCPKEFRLFTKAEGAEGHCEGMAPIVFWTAAFDWLDTRLASLTAAGEAHVGDGR